MPKPIRFIPGCYDGCYDELFLSRGSLVAEWIHFTLFGIILPTIKLKVYTFWGPMNSATKVPTGGLTISSAIRPPVRAPILKRVPIVLEVE